MCGIVGLFLKDRSIQPQLGALLSKMLVTMTDRGPDSAGIAIYGIGAAGRSKITVQSAAPAEDFVNLEEDLGAAIDGPVAQRVKDTHAVLDLPREKVEAARAALARIRPGLRVMSLGDAMEIYKEVGLPRGRRSPLRSREHVWHPRHRPHPHGDGIRRDHHGRPPVLHRRRPVPRA